MRNLILAIAACSLMAVTHAQAATKLAQDTPVEDDINKELLDNELSPAPDDLPPAPEYPYPGAKEEGITPENAPQTAKAEPAPLEPSAPIEPNLEIPRPVTIDKETGDYYYDTTPQKIEPIQRDAGHTATSVKDNGEYQYSDDTKPTEYIGREGMEKPIEIKTSGEYKYSIEHSPISGSSSFRFGIFGPPAPALRNEATTRKTTFKDVYLKDQYPVLFGDYEFPITSKVGHLGLRLGSGIFVASGNGQFAADDPNRRADDTPLEKYTFFMLPNTLTAQYRFEYKEAQLFVPYIEGGAGYFTFVEVRDDKSSPHIGGAATLVAAGGLNILMDWLDQDAIRNLDGEYGINHVYLSLDAREIVGLNKSYDFSSTIFNAGFMMQF